MGHWGKKPRHFSRKKLSLVVILLVLSFIFAISNNPNSLVHPVFGDYNTSFSHTRTPIFVDTIFGGPSSSGGPITFQSNCHAQGGGTSLSCSLTVGAGDAIIVNIFSIGIFNAFTSSDSQLNTYTQRVSSISASASGMGTIIQTTFASSGGSDSVTVSTGGANRLYDISVSDYSGPTGFGVSGTDQKDGTGQTGSSTITLTVGTNSVVADAFGFVAVGSTGTVTLTPNTSVRDTLSTSGNGCFPVGEAGKCITSDQTTGSGTDTISWSTTATCQCDASHSALEMTGTPSVTQDFSKVRWNFNSTCVSRFAGSNPGPGWSFDWSKGTSGSGGSNCSSADIAITKSTANLQTAAGRMLEMVTGWKDSSSSHIANLTLVLRTNGTLPSFSENYNPFNDVQARLVWVFCPTYVCNGGQQTIYIVRDQNHSVKTDTPGNDLIVQSKFGLNGTFTQNAQAILNFTGPTNFIESFGVSALTSTSNNTASSLQFGQDYNILASASFTGSPCGACNAIFWTTIPGAFGPNVSPFGIWSVPPSCSDPLNKAACSIPTATPVFQFNPLDPSSWGNAIIKGLLWVFTVAIPQGVLLLASVLVTEIKVTFNFIGNQYGWGNLGDNIISFFAGVSTLFGSIGTALGWLGSLVSSGVSAIGVSTLFANPYFTGVKNFLVDALNSGPQMVNLLNEAAVWFPSSYMIILIIFYFLLVFMNGLKGFFEWVHIVKWSAFATFELFARILERFIDLITAILGRLSVISPGHKFPRIPHLHPGPLPKITLTRDMALFDDPTAWFLSIMGTIFVFLWTGTAASGLPGATTSIVSSMSTLFLTIFGISFMVLLLYLPGWLLGKMYEKHIL